MEVRGAILCPLHLFASLSLHTVGVHPAGTREEREAERRAADAGLALSPSLSLPLPLLASAAPSALPPRIYLAVRLFNRLFI